MYFEHWMRSVLENWEMKIRMFRYEYKFSLKGNWIFGCFVKKKGVKEIYLDLNFGKVSIDEMDQNWIGLNFLKRILLPLEKLKRF